MLDDTYLPASRRRKGDPMTTTDGSVTRLLARIRDGHKDAVWELYERYFPRLLGLARLKLRGAPASLPADEEDVVQSAFRSFWRGVRERRFPHLLDRDGLWKLLGTMTARKAFRALRDERRLKRGGGRLRHLSELEGTEFHDCGTGLEALWVDLWDAIRQALGDPELRLEEVLRRRLEGYTMKEIAGFLGCSDRSVKRMLDVIRSLLESEVVA
jgi:RNA polymerase sigma-70 factor (ECF subfamily)